MKKGQKIKVFHDPLTEQNLEGVAKLKRAKKTSDAFDGRNIYICQVVFEDSKVSRTRKILEQES